MKRSLDDPADRAQKHRKLGSVRLPLDKLGFLEENRGGLGISPHPVHEVVWDCCTNGIKLNRYGAVDVVKIPVNKLEAVRKVNCEGCEENELMPPYSHSIEYGCLTKTHFVHALKLGKQGGRTVFNMGKLHIKWSRRDVEAQEINTQGVLCAIYDEEILDDSAALSGVMADDNLNASVQMREDETQAYSRVDAVIREIYNPEAHSQPGVEYQYDVQKNT